MLGRWTEIALVLGMPKYPFRRVMTQLKPEIVSNAL